MALAHGKQKGELEHETRSGWGPLIRPHHYQKQFSFKLGKGDILTTSTLSHHTTVTGDHFTQLLNTWATRPGPSPLGQQPCYYPQLTDTQMHEQIKEISVEIMSMQGV